jgi:hypothetical protein
MSRNLRSDMPQTAALVDQLRLQQGGEVVNALLRRAINGESGLFWASENGHEVGTRDTRATSAYFLNDRGISERCDPQWMVDAMQVANAAGVGIEIRDYQDHEEARERAVNLRKILEKAKYEN